MGFMNDKQQKEKKPNVTYLDVPENGTKRIRPLSKVPTSRWVHAINEVKKEVNGRLETVRYFSTVPCISVNKSGSGCDPCLTKDPLWDYLPPTQQRTQKGVVTHFPKRQQFEVFVWDYELNDVRMLRGKQVFEGMNVWWDSRKNESEKDASRLDWIVSKKGSGDRTKWTMSPDEVSKFEMTPEVQQKLQECQARHAEDTKTLSAEEFRRRIYGSTGVPAETQTSNDTPKAAASVVDDPPFDPTPAPAPVLPAPAAKSNMPLADFSKWLTQQQEFQGAGMTRVLIPALMEKINRVDYQSLSPDELPALKVHLEKVLTKLRGS